MHNIKNAEILSPAGNAEMLTAAVRCGADAVYLGAEEFSARRNARNFSSEELKKAIEYCHIRGVRVYLTLNILIKEDELSSAFSLAQSAYNMGIDGVIVQDIGFARILHKYIPDLKLHASTQMSVHSPSALPLLKSLGFCQVVAGREMSKPELISLCRKASELGIKIETFVHGALCMSVSGQCLLSAFLGSRSGNRGLCAGPCRLPFMVKNGTGYDLSLKDLSLLEYIGELHELGVSSFKIEGRMKRPEYVAAATAACRQALYNGAVDPSLSDALKNVFSRSGFTAGYYESKLGRDMFGIRTKEDVVSADKAFPSLHELYRFERKSVQLDIKAEILPEKPICICLFDGVNTVTVKGNIPQSAQNRTIDKETVEKSLAKLGNTPYFIKNIEISLSDGLYVGSGELNSLRREACEQLDKLRAFVNIKKSETIYIPAQKIKPSCKTCETVIRVESLAQIPEKLNGISAVILPLEENPDIIHKYNIPFIADIPRGITDEDILLRRLKRFKEKGGKAALCGNLSHITLVKEAQLTPIGDMGLNISNSESLSAVKNWGINAAIISCEEQLSDITALPANIKKGIISYGNIPLMLFRNCPLKNGISCNECNKKGVITDRLGVEFPVRCRGGYSELLNSLPIWLADRKDELSSLDFTVLYFTRETPERVKEIISAYKNGKIPDIKHTRGLYYRGTL